VRDGRVVASEWSPYAPYVAARIFPGPSRVRTKPPSDRDRKHAFLVSDPSKALDQARKAAITDARRKAEVYAEASGLRLGRVIWITEDSGFAPSVPMQARGASAALAAPVVIAPGEDTSRVKVTVGFDIAR
jgi:uncharacterized protein YggE